MRVIYVNAFRSDLITGGIKMCYRSVECLNAGGVDSAVWQPAGKPDWF